MRIKVYLKPNSSKDEVRLRKEGVYDVEVRAKAKENMANTKLIELMALYLCIPTDNIHIFSGHHRSSKVLEIK